MNERERIAALNRYEILDTPPEKSFDELTWLAARVSGCAVAAITFVGENRSWAKSLIGAAEAQIKRDLSFCDKVVASGELVYVPDLLDDERFRLNPFVAGDAGSRFYAGLPLKSAGGGAVIGTLCVIDRRPRELESVQLESLWRLANLTMQLLEARLASIERTRAEEDLQAQREFAGAVLENMADGVAACDAQGVLTYLNPAARELHGCDHASVRRGDWAAYYKLYALESDVLLRAEQVPLARALAGEIVHNAEVRIRSVLDSRTRTVVCSGRQILAPNGRLLGAVVTMKDTTEVRAAERARAFSELRYRSMLESAHDAIVAADRTGRVVIWNIAAERMFGYNAIEIVGQSITKLLPARAHAAAHLLLDQVASGGAELTGRVFEFNAVRKVGTEFPTESSLAGWRSGENVFLTAVIRDISDRKQIEAALIEARGELEQRVVERTADLATLTESIPQIVWQCSREGVNTYMNHRWAEYTGSADMNFFAFIHPDDQASTRASWFHAVKTGEAYEAVFRLRSRDNGYRWFLSRGIAQIDDGGAVIKWFGTSTDIHERKEFEAVQIAAQTARRASELKSEFLANMSHEIRTPISGIVGMTSLLLDTALDRAQRDYAETIQRCSGSLLTLVNDVLDFSKVEAGKLDLEELEFELGSLLSDTHRLFSVSARRPEVALVLEAQSAWPCRFMGDTGRIRQVLNNLLSNAVKFTHRGRVTLRARVEGLVGEATSRLRFEVVDTGIGIPVAARDRLFTAFSQADASVTRRFGGTGLGLSICKSLVELMNGEIGVESEPGRGSTFWFTLPLRHGASLALKPPLSARDACAVPFQSKLARVLVAEDNLVNQRVALAQLKKLGYAADAVVNGRQALKELEDKTYDIVLMDCHMPELDGYAATRQLRASSRPEMRDIPVIACTANAIRGEKERCLEAGMSDYLCKPFNLTELESLIRRWLPESSSVL